MFDSRDIEKYRSVKAPEGLKEKILQKAEGKKKARIIGNGAFVRRATVIAACFLMVATFTLMLREKPSDFYISVGGEELRRGGESIVLGDMPATMTRLANAPMGLPLVIEGKESVLVTVENGELWRETEEEAVMCALPYEAEAGQTIYFVPSEANTSKITLTAGDESITYAVENGKDPADIRITLQK